MFLDNPLLERMLEYYRYSQSSTFYKKKELIFNSISHEPWLKLDCRDDDKIGFDIHSLQMPDDFIYWHGVGNKKKEVKFDGVINRFYGLGFKTLRGYLSIPEYNDGRKLLVEVNGCKVIKTISNKEISENRQDFFSLMISFVNLMSDSKFLDDKLK